MKHLLKKHKPLLLATLLVALLYLLLFALGITCPLKYLFGISCPGCGMSRALFYLVTWRPAIAFFYHPLVFLLLPFLLTYALLFYKGKPKAAKRLLLFGALLLLLVFLYRLHFTNTDVVVFQPQNGAIGRFFALVASFFS